MERLYDIDLSGIWRFTPEGGEEAAIVVPGGGWLKQGFECEAGAYETTIALPDGEDDLCVFLELGAVNHFLRCEIGEPGADLRIVHEEVTAFTPQSIELTDYVQPGKSYVLRLFVRAYEKGRPIAPHWAEWSNCTARGIFRSARLCAYPRAYIRDVFVKTSVQEKTLEICATLRNTYAEDKELTLGGALRSFNGAEHRYPAIEPRAVRIPAGEEVVVRIGPLDWMAGPESYWWPNVPYQEGYRAQLHWLDLQLTGDGAPHDAHIRFGFRESRQEGAHFTLNGVRINYRGDNLQVANYDQIDFGGKGDAIDTLPGFLPPSADNPGWPKAVDNFLRLNYNVQRTHMGPWSPYMLDVCDEMGLMLIGESACRWNEFDMDDGRGFHEVKCLEDIIRRDRNHASIVRWSSKNEAQCPDPEYHLELYDAIKAIDDTRPIFEDYLYVPGGVQEPNEVFALLLDKPDFTWMDHYFSYNERGDAYFSSIDYNDVILKMENRPYGVTEANWMRSSTPAGLSWFATTVALGRARGASDMRPYVLVSSWASSVPGVKTGDLLTEEKRHPVYGEDNLPNPWSNAQIQLVQKAYHPLLALDTAFWWENRKCDFFGHFPVTAPPIPAREMITREIHLFNDEFDEGELTLIWEVREGSLSNWIWAKGEEKLAVRPGFSKTVPIRFEASQFNTYMFLTLKVYKAGKLRFEDELTGYQVIGGEDFRSEFNGEERIFL